MAQALPSSIQHQREEEGKKIEPWEASERASEGSNTCMYRIGQVSRPAGREGGRGQLVFCSAGRRTSEAFLTGTGTKDNHPSSPMPTGGQF